jgi:DNA-directed RNA polymerase subunit RPC12/RpoP
MPMTIACPSCGAQLTVSRTMAERQMDCPHCQATLIVPTPPPTGEDVPKVSSRGSSLSRPKSYHVACSECGAKVRVRAEHLGRKVQRPSCRRTFAVGLPAGPAVPVPVRAERDEQPPVHRSERLERSEGYQHQVIEKKSNLWTWFVGLPVGVLLLTSTFLLVLPILCCGGLCVAGALMPHEEGNRPGASPQPAFPPPQRNQP